MSPGFELWDWGGGLLEHDVDVDVDVDVSRGLGFRGPEDVVLVSEEVE